MSIIKKTEIPNYEQFEKYCIDIENSVFYNKERITDKNQKKGNCFDGEVEKYQFLNSFYNALFFIKGLSSDSGNDIKSKRFRSFFDLMKLFFGMTETNSDQSDVNFVYNTFFINSNKKNAEIYDSLKNSSLSNTFCFLVGGDKENTYGGTILTVPSTIRDKNKAINFSGYNTESVYWKNKNSSTVNPAAFRGLYGISSGIKFFKLTSTIENLDVMVAGSIKSLTLSLVAKYNPILSLKNSKSANLEDVCFPFDNYVYLDSFFPDPFSNTGWENIFWEYKNIIENINKKTNETQYYNANNNNIAIFKNDKSLSLIKMAEGSDLDYNKIDTLSISNVAYPFGSFADQLIKINKVTVQGDVDNLPNKFSSIIYIDNKPIPSNRKTLIFSYITNFLNPHLWKRYDLNNSQQLSKFKNNGFDFNKFKEQSLTESNNQRVSGIFDVGETKLSTIASENNFGSINNYDFDTTDKDQKSVAQYYSLMRYGTLTMDKASLVRNYISTAFDYDKTSFNRMQLACMLRLMRALYKNDYNWSIYIKKELNISTEPQGFNYGATTYSLNTIGVEKPYEKVMKDSITQNLMNPLYSVYKNSNEKNKQAELIEKIKSALYGYEINFDKRSEIIIPISVNMTLDGIGGLRINDGLQLDFLPDIYKNNIVLSINNISHTIGNEWTTDLQLIIRTKVEE